MEIGRCKPGPGGQSAAAPFERRIAEGQGQLTVIFLACLTQRQVRELNGALQLRPFVGQPLALQARE